MLDRPARVNLTTSAGSELDMHATAQGKVALAFGPASLMQNLAQRKLVARTNRTITRYKRLEAEVSAIRAKGWAGCFEEDTLGANAIAVPIFDMSGELFAVLALIGFTHELPSRPPGKTIAALKAAAREISDRLFSALT